MGLLDLRRRPRRVLARLATATVPNAAFPFGTAIATQFQRVATNPLFLEDLL